MRNSYSVFVFRCSKSLVSSAMHSTNSSLTPTMVPFGTYNECITLSRLTGPESLSLTDISSHSVIFLYYQSKLFADDPPFRVLSVARKLWRLLHSLSSSFFLTTIRVCGCLSALEGGGWSGFYRCASNVGFSCGHIRTHRNFLQLTEDRNCNSVPCYNLQ